MKSADASVAMSRGVLSRAYEIVEALLVSDRFPFDFGQVFADDVSEGNQLAIIDAAHRAVAKSGLDVLTTQYGSVLEAAIGADKTSALLQRAAELLVANRCNQGPANRLGGLIGDLRRLRDLHEAIAAEHRAAAAASNDPAERDRHNAAADASHRVAVRHERAATCCEGPHLTRIEHPISGSSIGPRLVAVASRPACPNAPPLRDVPDIRSRGVAAA